MTDFHTQQQPLRIVGFGAMIDKEHAQQQIGALWARAAAAGILPEAGPSFGVYTDYQDHLASRYRVVVGRPTTAPPREGEEVVELPPGRYATHRDRGAPGPTAARLWGHVWTRWEGRDARAFEVDWERYDPCDDGMDVTLYLGVRGPTPA